jgi:hypothetical protein
MTKITSFSNPHHHHHQIYKTSMTRGKEKHILNCRHGQGRDGESGMKRNAYFWASGSLTRRTPLLPPPPPTPTTVPLASPCLAAAVAPSVPPSLPTAVRCRSLPLFPSRHTARASENPCPCGLSLSLSQTPHSVSVLSRTHNPKTPKSALC